MKRLIVRIGLGIVMGGLLWGGLPANQAMAGFVTFNFTGTVNQHFSNTPLTGSITYNDAITNTGDAIHGRYVGAVTALDVHVGAFNGFLDPTGSGNLIRVVNHPDLGGPDSFNVRAPLAGGVGEHNYFRITLKDPSGTAFDNDHLPTTAPSLGDFAKARYRLVFEDGNGTVRIRGSLTSLTAVPLPTAVILFGAGLIAMVGLGAGSWRKRNTSLAQI